MMKRTQFATSLCVGLMAWMGAATAGGWIDAWCDRDDVTLGAEVLYYCVSAPSYNYGYVGRPSEAAHYLGIKPSGQWGFRLFSRLTSDDCRSFIQLDWTRVYVNQSVNRYETEVFTQYPLSSVWTQESLEIHGEMKHRYNSVNLRVGHTICRDCDSCAFFFGGLRYVNIERRAGVSAVNTFYTPASFATAEKSQFSGGAVEFGAGANYHIGCGFHLYGRLAGIAGVGEGKYQSIGVPGPDVTTGHPWSSSLKTKTTCITGLDARLAFRYSDACCGITCFSLVYTMELGYAAEYYFGAIATSIQYQDTGYGPFIPQTSTIGFVGPYLSFSVCF